MGKKVLSIEIGNHITKLSVLDYNKKHPKVYRCFTIETPYDSIEDGFIKDKQALAEEITKALHHEKISVGHVVFTIASSKVANREVTIPLVKEKNIEAVILAEASEYFPIDLSEYRVSYTILEKVQTKEVRQYRLLVVAAHNNLLTSYYELAKILNLSVEAIDYLGNSFYRIAQLQALEETSMVVHIGDQNTIVSIFHNNIPQLQRIVPYGADILLDTLLHNGYFKINTKEEGMQLLAKSYLLNERLVLNESQVAATSEYATISDGYLKLVAMEEITDSLEYLISNTLRVLDYYSSRFGEQKIQNIYLCGMGANFKGMETLFSNEIGITTRKLDTIKNVNFLPNSLDTGIHQGDFMLTIGGTIKPIGLVPTQFIERANTKSSIRSVAIIGSLSVVAAIVLAWSSHANLKDAESRREELTRQMAELASIEKVYAEHESFSTALTGLKELETYNDSSNEQLVALFAQLEEKLPSTVIVHSFRSSGESILMDVSVTTKEVAATTLIQLKKIDLITDVTTNAITEQTNEYGETVVLFSVSAKYKTLMEREEGAENE